MKPKKFNLILFPAIFLIMNIQCTHDPDISGQPEICFTGDILPVFWNNCAIAGCHDGTGESELVLTDYSGISSNVVPGKPDRSRLYQSITAKWGQKMPPDQPLSMENRIKVRLWIEQGAGETVCNDTIKAGGIGNIPEGFVAKESSATIIN